MLQEVSIFFFLIWILCKKIIYQEFIVSNPGQKLLCRESTSVTFMHEKRNSIHTKKARCKIFTNSYKNINMNKLISSTIPYCPSIYPLVFPTNGKEPAKCREGFSISEGQRSHFTSHCKSFTTLIKSPTLPLCPVSIHAIREDEIHVQQ